MQNKGKIKLFLLLIIILLAAVCSCDRQSFYVEDVRADAFIVSSSKKQGFSLYFKPDPKSVVSTLEVTSPDGSLKWSVPVEKANYQGSAYYGSSSFVMPDSIELPQGTYHYTVVNRDGRVLQGDFTISFSDVDGAIQRAQELPYFDESSNITVI